MSRPQIAIILVNFNGKADTLACLDSLLTLDDQDFCVIIADNASSDESIQAFLEWGRAHLESDCNGVQVLQQEDISSARLNSFLTLIPLSSNGGFAFANNVAIRFALTESSIQAVWLLNNDTIVQGRSLTALRQRLKETPGIGICGSTLIWERDRKTVQGAGVHFHLDRGYGYQIAQGVEFSQLPPRDEVEKLLTYVSGASMLVTRDFLSTVGLMEERYFLYFEELDWSLRNRGRFSLAWAPDSIVFHKEGASIGTNSIGRASYRSIYYQNVNMLRVVRRFAPRFLPMALLRVTARGLRFLVQGYVSGFRATALALLDFIRRRYRAGLDSLLMPRR